MMAPATIRRGAQAKAPNLSKSHQMKNSAARKLRQVPAGYQIALLHAGTLIIALSKSACSTKIGAPCTHAESQRCSRPEVLEIWL